MAASRRCSAATFAYDPVTSLSSNTFAFAAITMPARTQALHGVDDHPRRVRDLGRRLLGDRAERRDHGIGAHERRLHVVRVRRVTLSHIDGVGEPLLGRVSYERDHLVAALNGLRDDQPARTSAGTEDHDALLHVASLTRLGDTRRGQPAAGPAIST